LNRDKLEKHKEIEEKRRKGGARAGPALLGRRAGRVAWAAGVRWPLATAQMRRERDRLGRARRSVRLAGFFFCFLFSYFFDNFCILASNELKPVSKFF
jgi:hypothetical protein